jgi:flavin reductase (DIM6/NTAB) family NADH-FMN oxidoreductase RutF
MNKINLGSRVANYPMPVTIVGAHVNNKPNFLTIAWVSMVNNNPPKIAVALGNRHYTNKGIKENGSFSICISSANLIEKTDYVGLVSGEKVDKSDMFTIFYGTLKNAPMIEECPICIECKLDKVVENGSNELFIGDIIGIYTEDKYLTDNKLDFKKINPIILSQDNQEYWSLGEKIGQAWSIGKKIK